MDVDRCIEKVRECTYLSERELREVCLQVREVLALQSNVVEVASPVVLCGDIHGQFYDLLELFDSAKPLPASKYVFIGDFVDRGYHSVETLQLLLLLKLKHPKELTLLRGNHETRQITMVYGFYEEVIRKYGNSTPWKLCCEVFDYLPLGALVDRSILCIHGGLSPAIRGVDQIRTIDRKTEIPHQGPFCDLMWSDPEDIDGWAVNSRGAGYIFGAKPTRDFLFLNGLELVARAHQLVQEGYQFWFDHKRLVTIWSAPNYCYRCNNVASVLKVAEDRSLEFIVFDTVPQSLKSNHYKNVLPYFL